ncbi:MAG: DUF948 domain-containing protein [Actinomycetota bacterium]|nr:DUF948 domain-containing protein [Actinomycetota bacterium]
MNWSLFAAVILVLLAVLFIFIISVLIQLSRTLRRVNILLEDVRKEITPFLSKLNTTVDEVNSELARVDEIAKTIQEVSERVTITSKLMQEILSPSLIKLASISAGARKAIGTLIGGKRGE